MIRALLLSILLCSFSLPAQADYIRDLQEQAVERKQAEFGHWGWEKDQYLLWATHSNRLIPVYTFGTRGAGKRIGLSDYMNQNSPYRSEQAIRNMYGQAPAGTFNRQANYFDQTN